MDQKDFIFKSLQLLPHFDGDKTSLVQFITTIDTLVPMITSLPDSDKMLVFQHILNTLKGRAQNLARREQPQNWVTLKELLINEFGEHTPITSLIVKLENIKFAGSVKNLYEDLNTALCRYLSLQVWKCHLK